MAQAARMPTLDHAGLCPVPHLERSKEPTLATATDLAWLSVAHLTRESGRSVISGERGLVLSRVHDSFGFLKR